MAADNALRDARDKADRTIAGLTTRREALIEQLAAMQERLVGVARELESTIGREERAPEPDVLEDAVWVVPKGQPGASAEEGLLAGEAEAPDADLEAEAETPDRAEDRAIVLGEPDELAEDLDHPAEARDAAADDGSPDTAADDDGSPDTSADHDDGSLEVSADELWEGTETISLDIPDIPALDLDWDDLGASEPDQPDRDP